MTKQHIFGGILAGGIGSRMSGAGKPKQFLEVGGVPILVRTLQKFLSLEGLSGVVIAMHRDWRDYTIDLLVRHGVALSKVTIVDGGPTRFESLVCLAKGCADVSAKLGGAEKIIMVNHDCARPFVPQTVLEANVKALESGEFDMVTTSMPTIDTVLISKDGNVGDVVPERSTVFLDQGPQTVEVGHFLSLVETLSAEERARYMEAGRLYMEKGFKVGIVPGDRLNFKLTTPFDLAVAERLVKDGTVEKIDTAPILKIRDDVVADEIAALSADISAKWGKRLRQQKHERLIVAGDGSPVSGLFATAWAKAREKKPRPPRLVCVGKVAAKGAKKITADQLRLDGEVGDVMIFAVDANRIDNKEEILGLLDRVRELASICRKRLRLVVGVAMPSIPATAAGVRGFAERELSYYLAKKAERTPGIEYYLEIENLCREIQKASGKASVTLVRFANVFGFGQCHAPDVAFDEIIAEAFKTGRVHITEQDMAAKVGVTTARSAVACLGALVCSDKASGRILNFCDYSISGGDVKRALFVHYSDKLGFSSDPIGKGVGGMQYATLDCTKVARLKLPKGLPFEQALKRLVSYQELIPYDNAEHVDFYNGKLSAIQSLELDILKEIDRICRKHDIKYFLAGGTLLGQLRYKGPIPWDDDLDIGMLRDGYEKFKKVVEQELGPQFCYTSPYNGSGSHYTIDKVRIRDSFFSTRFSAANVARDGIFVDVLVYDQTSNNRFLRKLQVSILSAITLMLEIKWFNKARPKFWYRFSKFSLPIMRLIPFTVFHRVFDWVARWFSKSKNAKLLIDTVGKKLGDGPLPFAGLEDVKYVEFAGMQAPIPIDPVPYLTYAYGPNFITEPLLSKRCCPHNFARIDLGGFVFGEMDNDFRPVDLRGELYE